jgi:hypothetical protein
VIIGVASNPHRAREALYQEALTEMKMAIWRARTVLDKTIPLEVGESKRLRLFGRYAAIPARSIIDANGERLIEIRAPGATVRSTEACWDPASERLFVGVWCGRPPRDLKFPLRFPLPELSWFASFHLPGFAGEQTRVSVARGVITLRAPKVGAATMSAVVSDREKPPINQSDNQDDDQDDGGPPAVMVGAPGWLDAQAA